MPDNWPKYPTQNDHIRSHVVLFQAEHAAKKYYGVSGMNPSRASSTAIGVVTGSYMNGSVKPFSQSYITAIPAASAGKHRYDIIILDCADDTLKRVAGTEAVPTHLTDFLENLNPQPPELPSTTCYLIAIICVDQNGIQSGNHGSYCTAGVMDCRLPGPGSLHNQNTDQYMDYGGPNQSAVSDVKDAVTKKHAQGADQYLDYGGQNQVAASSLKNVLGGSIEIQVGDGVSPIQTGYCGRIKLPHALTLSGWEIVADQSGSLSIEVKYATFINFPTLTSLLTAAISNDQKASGSNSTALPGGVWVVFNVLSCSSICQATLSLQGLA